MLRVRVPWSLCTTEYLDRFSSSFIERRQAALQRFLDRIAVHPHMQKSDNLRLFLEAKAWVRARAVGSFWLRCVARPFWLRSRDAPLLAPFS